MSGDEMPKPGFSKLTISDKLKEQLRRIAKVENLSMPGLILRMLENLYPEYLVPEGTGEEKENE